MADEYESLIDQFGLDDRIKKEMGTKRFHALVGQLKGTEFYRLADRQNDFMMGLECRMQTLHSNYQH